VKHIYSTGVIYDHHLRSSRYFYNTGHKRQHYETLFSVTDSDEEKLGCLSLSFFSG